MDDELPDSGTNSPGLGFGDVGNLDPVGWWDVIDGAWRWIVYPNPG